MSEAEERQEQREEINQIKEGQRKEQKTLRDFIKKLKERKTFQTDKNITFAEVIGQLPLIMFRAIWLLIFVYGLYYFSDDLFDKILQFQYTILNTTTLPFIQTVNISAGIFALAVFTIGLSLLFPYGKNETKQNIVETVVFIAIYSLIIINLYYYFYNNAILPTNFILIFVATIALILLSFFTVFAVKNPDQRKAVNSIMFILWAIFLIISITTYLSASEQDQANLQTVGNATITKTKTVWSKMLCFFDPVCAANYGQDVEETQRVQYRMTLEKPITNYVYDIQKNKRDSQLSFGYEIVSTKPIKLIKHECKVVRVSENADKISKEVFDSQELNEIILTTEDGTFKSLSCDMSKMKLVARQAKYTIESVLYFEHQFSFSQQIPAYNYEGIVTVYGPEIQKRFGEGPYTSTNLLSMKDILFPDYKTDSEASHDASSALTFRANTLNLNLPLILGDDEARTLTYKLTIEKADTISSNFGTFVEGEITNVENGQTFEVTNKEELLEPLTFTGNELSKWVDIKENEGFTFDEGLGATPRVFSLIITMKGNFEKKSTFTVELLDTNYIDEEEAKKQTKEFTTDIKQFTAIRALINSGKIPDPDKTIVEDISKLESLQKDYNSLLSTDKDLETKQKEILTEYAKIKKELTELIHSYDAIIDAKVKETESSTTTSNTQTTTTPAGTESSTTTTEKTTTATGTEATTPTTTNTQEADMVLTP